MPDVYSRAERAYVAASCAAAGIAVPGGGMAESDPTLPEGVTGEVRETADVPGEGSAHA